MAIDTNPIEWVAGFNYFKNENDDYRTAYGVSYRSSDRYNDYSIRTGAVQGLLAPLAAFAAAAAILA